MAEHSANNLATYRRIVGTLCTLLDGNAAAGSITNVTNVGDTSTGTLHWRHFNAATHLLSTLLRHDVAVDDFEAFERPVQRIVANLVHDCLEVNT